MILVIVSAGITILCACLLCRVTFVWFFNPRIKNYDAPLALGVALGTVDENMYAADEFMSTLQAGDYSGAAAWHRPGLNIDAATIEQKIRSAGGRPVRWIRQYESDFIRYDVMLENGQTHIFRVRVVGINYTMVGPTAFRIDYFEIE